MSSTLSTTHRSDLVVSLEKHNATFTQLLSLIPSKFYVAPDPDEADSKWMKNKKRKTGEEIKEHKRRAKHDKLDPANSSTAADALERSESKAGPSSPRPTSIPPALPASIRPLPPSSSITDLRARLQSKLDGFRRDRGIDDSDPQSRDALEAERRKKRGEMRDKRRNDRKDERRKAREDPKAKTAKTQLIVPQLPRDTDTLSYPTVSLPTSSSSRSRAPIKSLSNPSQALAHLEKHQAHLAALPEDKRKEIEDRERWAKAEERAMGGKVADQEGVLKKAVRRMEKTKAKSGKEWAERKKSLDKANAVAIKKRTDNIAARAEVRRNKRMGIKDKGKQKAKGNGRPGFEGGKGGKKGKSRPGFEGGKNKGKAGKTGKD